MPGEGSPTLIGTCASTLRFLLLQSNQKVNARWTTDEQLLAVQGEFSQAAVSRREVLTSSMLEQV